MRKIYALLLSMVLITSACTDDDPSTVYQTVDLAIQLEYPENYATAEGVAVQAKSSSGVTYKLTTAPDGSVTFSVPTGLYEISASEKRLNNGKSIRFSAVQSNIAVSQNAGAPVSLSMTESVMSQIIIKELYISGCQKDDGSGAFYYDKYVVLYNNSDEPAELQNLCLAMVLPYNSTVTNSDIQNGSLFYEAEGWIPAGLGYFYFPNQTNLLPGEQIVVAFNNANDNTITYSNSVDLGKSEYYVTYEPQEYTNTSYHPAPAATIPTAHYLPGFKYGTGNAWALSNTSPAFFLFMPENTTPGAFASATDNESFYGGNSTQVRKKVPANWVLDGIEVFKYGVSNNVKRFTSAVDAGSVALNGGYGYTLYRNVDKDATEAIEANAGKLVYDYSLGTTAQNGSTDPSGIDAEASRKLGAQIIYLDTNNSGADFHQRAQASLKN